MKFQRLAALTCFVAAGILISSCDKETPRQEQKPAQPHDTRSTTRRASSPRRGPRSCRSARGLEAALKGQDLEQLTKLTVRSGALNQADLDYVTKSLKIEAIDLSAATLRLGDEDKGFYGNSTLKKITAPADIEKTQKDWFSNTLATEIIFPGNKLKSFGGAVYNEKLKSITLPNSVEEIGAAAFANSNFESITLSTSLKSIPTEAFKGCRRLTKLTIPTSVTEIKDNVFTGCAQLKETPSSAPLLPSPPTTLTRTP